ncbi:MAG: DegQ family serine endoprotease [Spirochaetales bacterium]|jgi:Do/DeqQ family serine protease|nr:DegQ family serine endoprotease [Spirochaetales bacterium]
MKLSRIFLSKKLFVFNLVFLGIVIGFSLALFSFSCSIKTSSAARTTAYAQDANLDAIKSLENLQNSFRSISEGVRPSVVTVNVTSIRRQGQGDRNMPWFYYFFGRPDEGNNAPDREFRNSGLGSGVIMKKAGSTYYVLTNNHVVDKAESISIHLFDGREFKTTLIGKDERKDLAVVSFDSAEDIPVAVIGNSDTLRVGDWVLAVGSPFGLESTVTAGIVSALGRRGGPEGNISDFIQTDASINQGNSGGALVNLAGDLVGINTWITSPTGGSIGLGFAIPINNVKRAVDDLIGTGSVQYGWLGVSISSLTQDMVEPLKLPDNKGAFVYHVFKGSPADKAGILPGDFITILDNQKIPSSNDLVQRIADLLVGHTATFSLYRQGKAQQTTVTITARDTQQTISEQSKNLWPGFSVIPLTDTIRKELELSTSSGVLIQSVESRTPGALAGLQSGDIIVEVNTKKISSILDFYEQLNDKRKEKLEFVYERKGVKMSIGIFR